MTVSFKPPVPITIFKKTPTDQLIECMDCGGANRAGATVQDLGCNSCDLIGYTNFWTGYKAQAYRSPRHAQRWNPTIGGVSFSGEAAIKVDPKYAALLDGATHIKMDGIEWEFSREEPRGQGFGNDRIILILNRK